MACNLLCCRRACGGWTSAAGSRAVKIRGCLRLIRVVVRSGGKDFRHRQTPAGRPRDPVHFDWTGAWGVGRDDSERKARVRRLRQSPCRQALARQGAHHFEPQPGDGEHQLSFDQRAIQTDRELLRFAARAESDLYRQRELRSNERTQTLRHD